MICKFILGDYHINDYTCFLSHHPAYANKTKIVQRLP